MYKYSVPLGAFGLHRDRFCEYGERLSLEEMVKVASEIEGLDGVSVTYYLSMDVAPLKNLLEKYGVGFSHFTVDLSRDRQWLTGSIASPNHKVRELAVEHIKDCMDASKKMGVSLVNLCPMGDGYDYLFQEDYSKAWRWLINCLKEVCSYRSDVRISLEYKRREPRANIYISDIGRALWVCEKVGAENLGVTVDIGHSLLAGENPAEAICLAAQEERLFSVHLNDNFRDWDWDLIPASINFWHFIESLAWMIKVGYSEWIFMDVYPSRVDPAKAISRSIRNVRGIVEGLQKAGVDRVLEELREHNYIRALKIVLENCKTCLKKNNL
ncbi:MAG: sugar phosphate isomerase/epimerase [Candidatus Bathyarchaeia archaeon]